ncbi:fungal-specific transcription factor domain-containing protein [Diaporthe sp. PMI_573]|nr:fungal-specific transcription factor domain-containing protein [Diaporthaceae sp. PMI_573]
MGTTGPVKQPDPAQGPLRRSGSPASSSSHNTQRLREGPQRTTAEAETSSQALQRVVRKRRRTTKACDDCRRKKIKCDGNRPCSSCADFDSKCCYTGISTRGRGTNPSGTGSLERKALAAETLLRRFMPHIDLDNPEEVAALLAQPAHSASPAQHDAVGDQRACRATTTPASVNSETTANAARRMPLVENVGQLDLTATGEYGFHGMSSGAAFLSRITQQFPGLFRYDSRMPFLPEPGRPYPAKTFDLPGYAASPSSHVSDGFSPVPPKPLAHDLCEFSFSRATCILRVVHAPSFWRMFDRLYEERPQRYTPEERRFVGLLFSVMALGSMYDVDENDPTNPDHYAVAMERGYKFYTLGRHYLQDITECSDMTTLQALVFNIQFLQATGELNSCHTFLGIALRSALRMGLHRHLPAISLGPIKDETRRRLFYTIRQMDIYLSTTLGLPLLLEERDIDQPWPAEVDDEYITDSGIQWPPPGTPSILEASNANLRLMHILAKVVRDIYPPTGTVEGPAETYMISFSKIRELDQDLRDWQEQLSPMWRPGHEEDIQVTRVKILLRFTYAHVQMMLYRPFIQYYSRQIPSHETVDERYFALASAGINVCRNIIHIGLEIRKQAVLIGPYWFITYTQFFAVLSLLLFVLNNPNQPGVSDLFADAKLGKDCISGLTQRSLAADRVTVALNSLFDQLPDQYKPKRPRPHDGRPQSPTASRGQSSCRHRDEPVPAQPPSPHTTQQHQWALNSFSAEDSATASPMEALQATPTAQLPGHASRPFQDDFMDFLLEDPFAYPLMPGVGLAENELAAFPEDSLRLPLYNTEVDIEGQLLDVHLPDLQNIPPLAISPPNVPLDPSVGP